MKRAYVREETTPPRGQKTRMETLSRISKSEKRKEIYVRRFHSKNEDFSSRDKRHRHRDSRPKNFFRFVNEQRTQYFVFYIIILFN